MGKRQLLALFLCSLVPWTIGNGLAPLLPVYAAKLGASPAEAGCQMALTYAALAAGAVAAGWLADRLQGKKVLIIAGGVLSIPALCLMGQVRDPWALTAVWATWCFWGGLNVAQVNVLAGLAAAEGSRGAVFGLLSLNAGLGALFGGLAVGPIVERWGYPALFAGLALFGLLWPIAGFFVQDSKPQQTPRVRSGATWRATGLGRSFYCLFLGSLAATLAAYVFIFGRSLVMSRLGFDVAAISTTSALSEVPILPLPLLLGWLSDRFGRRPFLAAGYLAASCGLLGLAAAASTWHFWVCSVSVTISLISGGIGTAMVADVVPRQALSKGLSLFGATAWVAGVLGCAGAGYAVQHFGPVSTCVAGALLPLAAAALLLASGQPGRGRPALPSGATPSAEPLPATA